MAIPLSSFHFNVLFQLKVRTTLYIYRSSQLWKSVHYFLSAASAVTSLVSWRLLEKKALFFGSISRILVKANKFTNSIRLRSANILIFLKFVLRIPPVFFPKLTELTCELTDPTSLHFLTYTILGNQSQSLLGNVPLIYLFIYFILFYFTFFQISSFRLIIID